MVKKHKRSQKGDGQGEALSECNMQVTPTLLEQEEKLVHSRDPASLAFSISRILSTL